MWTRPVSDGKGGEGTPAARLGRRDANRATRGEMGAGPKAQVSSSSFFFFFFILFFQSIFLKELLCINK